MSVDDLMALAEEYAFCAGNPFEPDSKAPHEALRAAIDKALRDAYADGRSDEAEAQQEYYRELRE